MVFNCYEYSELDERMSRQQSPRTVKAPVLVNTLASAGASPFCQNLLLLKPLRETGGMIIE